MPSHRTLTPIAGLLLSFILAAPVAAQSFSLAQAVGATGGKNSLTISGTFGYLTAHTNGTGGTAGDTMPAGWIATVEAAYNGKYVGVAEFAGNYQTDHLYRTNLGGGRYVFLRKSNLTLFAQALAGVGRSAVAGDGDNAFTLQPGAGIDLFPVRHVGIRLQGDYDWRPRDTGDVHGARFGASVVIR